MDNNEDRILPTSSLKPWVVIVGKPNYPGQLWIFGAPDLSQVGLLVLGCEFSTKEEAEAKAEKLSANSPWTFQVFDNRKNVSGIESPINNCICPTCQNSRCSTSESVCWLCGNSLKGK